MSRVAGAFVILGVATMAACGRDTFVEPAPPYPATITVAGGNGQSGTVSRALPVRLVAVVMTNTGVPATNVRVDWTVTTGSGKLSTDPLLLDTHSQLSVLTDGQGHASVTWILGNAPGNQSATATFADVLGAPASFTATALAPIVLQFDGIRWRTVLEDTLGLGASLTSIWGATPSDIFAVGKNGGGSTLLMRYNGTAWIFASICGGGSFAEVTGVWGNSASDVFAVDHGGLLSFASYICHYDGQVWTAVYTRACTSCGAVRAVWSRSRTDAFAVGDSGMVLHYDGTGWNPQASGTTQHLRAVWGDPNTSAVFAAGEGGTILHYDGNAWQAQTTGTTESLYAIWGTSGGDVFAVGASGKILHYDGAAWSVQNSGSTQTLRGVWGNSGTSVFAVGDASTILYYDGTGWTAQATTASINLTGVWGSSASNVFAVGAPR